jgi:hypothetical protein
MIPITAVSLAAALDSASPSRVTARAATTTTNAVVAERHRAASQPPGPALGGDYDVRLLRSIPASGDGGA